jgi:hypothetical protein
VTTINEGGTGYSWANRLTGWDDPKLGRHSGWRNPSWVDDDTVMISDPTHAFNFDVILDTISDGDSGNLVHNWFSDLAGGNPHMAGGDISRDRRKLAFVTGASDETLTLYGVNHFPTTFPDSEAPASTRPLICYRYSKPKGGSFSTPTFSPNGSRVAWAEADGIKVVSVPSFANGCTTDGASPHAAMLIPGGKQPDWGPAGVPAGHGAGGGLAVKSADAKLRKALAKGLKVRIRVPSGGRLTAKAVRRGRTLASGSKAVHAGSAAVKLRFTKSARRSLGHARRVKLRIKVALRPAGGAVQRAAVSLTLTR